MFFELVENYLLDRKYKEFKRSQIIYHEGDVPTHVYFVESGLIGLFHISETGKETFFRVFSKGDILGHRSLFAAEPYHASAVALTPVTLKSVSAEECEKICLEHPEIMRKLIKKLSIDLGKSELRMSGLLDKTANKRISESLVYLKLKYPDYTWTRKEIAEYSGSTYETVTRLMTYLEKNNLIKKIGRDYQIDSPEKLLALEEQDLTF